MIEEPLEFLCPALDGFDLTLDSESLKQELENRLIPLKMAGIIWVKIGMELYNSADFDIIGLVKSYGFKIFLDLKLKDIAYDTVKNTAGALTAKGVEIFNVHADGGYKMMVAAVEGARESSKRLNIPMPKIIGVTVLTSMDYDDLVEIGYFDNFFLSFLCKHFNWLKKYLVKNLVLRLGRLAEKAGLDGIVSSALDLEDMTYQLDEDFFYITPAIRLPDGDTTGQKRVATPDLAIFYGSKLLVVGRPIYGKKTNEGQIAAIEAIVKLIEVGLEKRRGKLCKI